MKPKNTIWETEFSAEIEAVGKEVKLFWECDKIFVDSGSGIGTHAEYICPFED